MTTPKLDIFRVLGAIDGKDRDFYDHLSEEEQKAFQPFLVQRWMSGTSRAGDLFVLNEVANTKVFTLQRHKALLYKLLVACSAGKKQRYVWNKLPNKATSGRPNALRCVIEYFGYSVAQATDAMVILSRSTIIEMAEELGWQAEDIAKIRREIKASEDKPSKADKGSKTDDLLEF